MRNHRFQIGLQFLAKEPEFAAFTKLQIDDKGDLADLPDYTTELYEAMTRVCADELWARAQSPRPCATHSPPLITSPSPDSI